MRGFLFEGYLVVMLYFFIVGVESNFNFYF